ncbi:PREDICTED: sodium/hydrogen exchanger 11 [Chinchilla lanigera]|uniref:Solute carrier family 9 member C2 (putative) n=1 Tax=Chinchilla lanigera TaxID=34839 RepID=A0A8C2VZ27_CHILA|nr:PREDICTED: sodium/hydrogen exchanger 11 [Chinchilla lanigera]XP_013376244.1 PREDICTED: sodium/hydrogen exchanger 11 [Chinchilla lanigera]
MNNSFWTQEEGSTPDLLCGRSADYLVTELHFPLLICAISVLGGVLKVLLKNHEVIVLTILSVLGFVLGQLAFHFVEVHQVVYPLLRTPSFSLYCYFIPLFTFMASLGLDFYILKNVFWQISLTGLISIFAELVLTGYVVMRFNERSWDLQCCIFFTIALSIIDPLHSANSLETIGISKMYTDFFRGESLVLCSVMHIFFGVFRGASTEINMFRELDIILGIILDIFGSIVFGYWCARVIEFILTDPFNNSLTNIILSFSLVYMTFYVVEYFGMSGIVALITVGLNLDSLSFKANMEHVITKFLLMFSSVYEHLIYTFFGIVIGCGEIEYFTFHSIVFTLLLFLTVNFVRIFTTIALTPILMHLSHEYNWQLGIVISWTGIRGVYSLLLSPDIYNLAEQKVKAPHMFIFHIQTVSLLTMGINSHMMTWSAKTLGLCAISLPRQRVIQNVTHHIQQILQNTITLFKTEKLLTNVNWTLVEEKTKIEYVIPPDNLQSSHLSSNDDECPTDEVLIEEAKLHVAIIQMSSFEKQCNEGLIEVEAARILIGATKIYCLIQGKFMSIYDVSTYVRARSWLIMFKNILTYMEYHKERGTFVLPGRNRLILFVYRIIFSEEFEYAGYIITFMYIYPLIIHLWPAARKLNVSALSSMNYYYLFLYVLQAALKITILRKKYFQQHWNVLDFIIMLVGLFDVFCIYCVILRPGNLFLIQLTVTLGYFRIVRLLPLCKLLIPVLINKIDVQIKKHLSLVYTITKGYAKSQEDAKVLVKQISGRESVYQKLHDILDKNKQDAIRELGFIEHENRDVVIALKTKQAVRRVFAKAQKRLTFLWSRGIMDRHEAISMNNVFLNKIKALKNFPMVAPPPTPGQYLSNIIWLENKDVLIEFFKERTKLAYFNYGDVVCREGEMPLGIYLIISGMASLHSTSPTFGIDCIQRPDFDDETLFTEYCTSGQVLGELSCLLREEMKYTAICETTLQAFFISSENLYEGFDIFWPSLEYKIWLNFALNTAYQYFETSIADEHLDFQKCVMNKHAYVESLPIYTEMTLNNVTMKFVIIVYGYVINSATEEPYLAPYIIPKTCNQIQGMVDISKLLIIQASGLGATDHSGGMVNPGLRTAKTEQLGKKKDKFRTGHHFRKPH